MKRSFTTAMSLLIIGVVYAQPEEIRTGPPAVEIGGTVDTNVVNTVDTNVVNTVDANVVNSISADGLIGRDFSGEGFRNITFLFSDPVELRAISASIASAVAGEICNISASIDNATIVTLQKIGFSAMSNGQAVAISRNYEIPIGPVTTVNFDINGNGSPNCWTSVSVVAEASKAAEAARFVGEQDPVRIETQ